MNSEELKNYFRQVLDIESAVYTNDNVMKRYKLYRESREPDKPIKKMDYGTSKTSTTSL